MPLTISEAYLAGLTSTSILYGISVATYYACARVLIYEAWQQRAITRTRLMMFACATGMWLVGTIGVGQMLQHMLNAFIHHKGEGGSDAGLSDIRDPMNIVHALTYPLQSAMGDSFLVYRTWIVYNRSWAVIAFPILVLLGDVAAGFGIAASELTLQSDPLTTATNPKIVPWTTSYFTLTLCLNLMCTGLIITRILFVSKKAAASRVTESPLQRILRIILESGLIYTTTSLIVLIVIITRSTALYIAADSFIPITSICFHLIILRTDSSREDGSSQDRAPSLPLRFMPRGNMSNPVAVAPIVTVSRHVDEGSVRDVPIDSQDSLWSPRLTKAED